MVEVFKFEDTSKKMRFTKDASNNLRRTRGERAIETVEESTEYPQGVKLILIFVSLVLTTFLVALDGTIIATATPTITSQFNSLSDLSWYNSAILLTTCAFQLPYGRAYTLLDIKWTYLSSIVIFEIGSIVCGAAPNSVALIIGRAIAGIGGAGIFGGAFIIIAESTPLSKRALFTGVLGGTFGLASVVGPLLGQFGIPENLNYLLMFQLGGVFTTQVTWRWCFYINLPLGGLALVVVFFLLPQIGTKDPERFKGQKWWQIIDKFDPIGTSILIPSLICLLIALQWGGQKFPWSSGRVIALLVVFGVTIMAWVIIQYLEDENATVPRSVVAQRSVFCAAIYIALGSAAFLIVVYYLPIWFQAIKQDSAQASGIHNLPLILSVVAFILVSGGMVVALGYYVPWLIVGSILMTVGAGLLSTLNIDSGLGQWLGYQILYGAGVGCSLEQCSIAVQTVLPKDKIPAGTSLIIFARALGGAIGTSIGQNVFEQRLRSLLSEKVPNLDPNLVTEFSGATNLIHNVRAAVNGNTTAVETVLKVYNRSITDTFYVAIAMGALTLMFALGVEWKSVKKEKPDQRNDVETGTGRSFEEIPVQSVSQDLDCERKSAELSRWQKSQTV